MLDAAGMVAVVATKTVVATMRTAISVMMTVVAVTALDVVAMTIVVA